jgi:predicted molibdopterin-dependent oxidoreductase YjgC
MFKQRPDSAGPLVGISINGKAVTVPAGISVAAAVLLNYDGPTRTTPVTGSPRAPFCMMGVCFECLMEIDGTANRQACMLPVAEGMRIVRQAGARQAK